MQLPNLSDGPSKPNLGRPRFALVTLLPLVWLLAVTMTAGAQKIFHSDPRIGFLAQVEENTGFYKPAQGYPVRFQLQRYCNRQEADCQRDVQQRQRAPFFLFGRRLHVTL